MTIHEYLSGINTDNKTGRTTEHSYRGHLQTLIKTIVPDVTVINEPKQQDIGAPDYILTKGDIPVCYIETKILATDLHNKNYKEQFDRYKTLPKLIITNYIDFEFYEYTNLIATCSIGEKVDRKIIPLPENFKAFETLVKNFAVVSGQTIKSPESLAKLMANNARVLADVIHSALKSDVDNDDNSTLHDQLKAFQGILIHDLTPKEFSDIYAQTIAYGMFSARLHDTTLETFTRREAAELIPSSNPFLRKLFDHIAGIDLDKRILWIVNALVDIFRATDVKELLKNFGKSTQQNDPIIYFYETFLSEYDPKLRKSRGVWYTPEPVVKFIVRAVDDILKTEFGLSGGLSNTDKVKVKIAAKTKATADGRSKLKNAVTEIDVHKVQILDPATGTATFLAEVVKHIYKEFEGQKGIWSSYVDNHLLPRLNGFELLMASYAMAHLKLDMLLTQTGYKSKDGGQRLRVYLTNSLEEHHPDTGTLFASMLSQEANEANFIKRDVPVMVVIGNPPYSGVSNNKGVWITDLIDKYKYVDGVHFNERKHWLNDDYVKFIRLGQHFVDKTGDGVLAYINNHSFLDNTTFRGMRWSLLNSFDEIYIIDLHGNSKKNEVSPDGSPDNNVFDIMQGVSINIFIKNGKKKKDELGKVFHFDLYGKREYKYSFLNEKSIDNIPFVEINYSHPNYFFIPKDFKEQKEYDSGFLINEMFKTNTTGIVTMGDGFIISESREILKDRLTFLKDNPVTEEWLKTEFNLGKNYAEWILKNKQLIEIDDSKIIQIDYRPFDIRWTYFDNKLIWRWRFDVMQHFINKENVALMTCRQIAIDRWEHVGVTKHIADDSRVSNRTKERGYIFPLYLDTNIVDPLSIEQKNSRTPNIEKELVKVFEGKINLSFANEKEQTKNTFAPIDILDYIYAVLHSLTYRETYKEFLKIDFPRIPYPKNVTTFWDLVKLGGELRVAHLLENTVSKPTTRYSVDGDNIVTKIIYNGDKVYINDTQYFANVPQAAWDFYIGGYQPAQKWLKDRKDKELSYEDITHYQKIIASLIETDRLMKDIDLINVI